MVIHGHGNSATMQIALRIQVPIFDAGILLVITMVLVVVMVMVIVIVTVMGGDGNDLMVPMTVVMRF